MCHMHVVNHTHMDILNSTHVYDTNHPQLKRCTCVTHVTHVCDMYGVNHTRVGFLGSTHMYTQYLYMRIFTCEHVCMAAIVTNYLLSA